MPKKTTAAPAQAEAAPEETRLATTAPPEVTLVGYEDDEDPDTAKPQWAIHDQGTVEWALGRIADLEDRIAENTAVAETARWRATAWERKQNAKALNGVAFFEAKIKEYADAHRDKLLAGGPTKSRKLISGTLGWRENGGDLAQVETPEGKEALLQWALGQPVELELVKSSVAWSAIKKFATENKMVPPGTVMRPKVDNFYVTTAPAGGPGLVVTKVRS